VSLIHGIQNLTVTITQGKGKTIGKPPCPFKAWNMNSNCLKGQKGKGKEISIVRAFVK
jgi:hypothetical protein